jgi:hypothetical protein
VELAGAVELVPDDIGRLARVVVDGTDHTAEVRSPAVDAAVSAVSAVPEVRAALLARQRALAAEGGIVMAGRDIGTVVLPDADLKIYLDCLGGGTRAAPDRNAAWTRPARRPRASWSAAACDHLRRSPGRRAAPRAEDARIITRTERVRETRSPRSSADPRSGPAVRWPSGTPGDHGAARVVEGITTWMRAVGSTRWRGRADRTRPQAGSSMLDRSPLGRCPTVQTTFGLRSTGSPNAQRARLEVGGAARCGSGTMPGGTM